jgi:cytochrome c oxidase cbb3-type subunit III
VIPRPQVFFLAALTAVLLCGCGLSHGRPTTDSETVAPDDVLDFSVLFSQNCAGCHGVEGKGSVAIALSNPEYLAVADDATILQVVSHGRPGTPMPAFAKTAGGMLTDKQVSVIVAGIRKNWGRSAPATSVALPPYTAKSPGNPQAGSQLFQTYCASCHGINASNGDPSILNPSFLALVSDPYLRTIVIVGRPELNAPDFRGNLPGHVMSDQEITDVVAWLSSQRTAISPSQVGAAMRSNHPEHPAREGASNVH